jgi:hypothetical protein
MGQVAFFSSDVMSIGFASSAHREKAEFEAKYNRNEG